MKKKYYMIAIGLFSFVICMAGFKRVLFASEIEAMTFNECLTTSICSGSGKNIVVKKGETIYSNETLRFAIADHIEDVEGEVISSKMFYALSYDKGQSFGDKYELEDNVYEISPCSNGDEYYVQFYKIYDLKKVIRNEELTEEEDTEGNTEEKIVITHVTCTTNVYHIFFDLQGPNSTEKSGIDWNKWVNYERSALFSIEDLESGILRATIKEGDALLFEYHMGEESGGEKYIDVAIPLNNEAKDENGHDIFVQIEDMAGNYYEQHYTYYYDKTCPRLAYQGLPEGSVSASDTILNLSADDSIISALCLKYRITRTNRGSSVVIADKEVIPDSGTVAASEKITDDGEYFLWAIVEDKAGNKSENISIRFRIDKNAPNVFVEGFEEGKYYKTDVYPRIQVNEEFYSDAVMRIRITRKWPGGEEIYSEEEIRPDSEKYLRNIILNSDGDYNISVTASDAAGNSSALNRYVRVDKTAPELNIGGMLDKQIGKEIPKLFISSKELFYDTTRVSVSLFSKIDGNVYSQPQITELAMDSQQSNFPFEVYEEGEYLLSVRAYDAAGNENQKQIEFVYDCSAPIVGWINDVNKKYLKEFMFPKRFAEMINDRTATKYKAYLNANDIKEGDVITGDGKYVLRIIATDAAGNISDETVEFIVDNTAPRIVAKGLKNDGIVKTGSTIELTLYDREDRFEKCLYNGEDINIVEGGKKCLIDIKGNGKQQIEVKAVDEAGNTTEKLFMLEASALLTPKGITKAVKTLTASDVSTLNNNSSVKIDKNDGKKYLYFFIPVFLGVLAVLTLKILGSRQIDTTK